MESVDENSMNVFETLGTVPMTGDSSTSVVDIRTVWVGIPWLDIPLSPPSTGPGDILDSRHRRWLVEHNSEPSDEDVVATIMKNIRVDV